MSDTIPGGYYVSANGLTAHDANGNVVPLRSTVPAVVPVANTEPQAGTPGHAETLTPVEPVKVKAGKSK